MAEFCFVCQEYLLPTPAKKPVLVLSRDLHLCEGCGQYKQIITWDERLGKRVYLKMRFRVFFGHY